MTQSRPKKMDLYKYFLNRQLFGDGNCPIFTSKVMWEASNCSIYLKFFS